MEEVIEFIKSARRAVILPHVKADGDAVGSCLALRHMLGALGVESVIYTEEPVERRLEFLDRGAARVYRGEAEECDSCIALDCGDPTRLGKRLPLLEGASRTLNIDHHKTNTAFCGVNYVEPDASSVGEVLFKLSKRMGLELGREAAGCLYAAICSDTGCFAYSNASPETFRIAAELIETGIDHAEIARLLFDCAELESELMKAELTGGIRSYYGGRLRVVSAAERDTEKYGLKPEEIRDLVDLPRRIRGTELAAALKESEDGIRVSLRSNGAADAARVAAAFGGGGHTKAAGCTIRDVNLAEAEQRLVAVCGEALG